MENVLLMPFIDESKSFVHGFECGQIWQQMKENKRFESYLFHTENKKQIEMTCKRFHYSCLIDKIDETWSCLTASLTENAN